MKCLRLNWVFDVKGLEKALYALSEACDAFAQQHSRRPRFTEHTRLIFSGFHFQTKNKVYDYLTLEDDDFTDFLERRIQQYRPLRVFDSDKIMKLPPLLDTDWAFRN